VSDQIMVTVLIRSVWIPNLEGDVEYPTVEDYAIRVREQFARDPLTALRVLPDVEVKTIVEVVES
jgi:hypothetical protein